MNIAFITYTFPPQIGGMQNWSHQMAEAYALAGHTVDVYHLVRGVSKHSSALYNYIPVYIDTTTDQTCVPVQFYSSKMIFKTCRFLIYNFKKLFNYDIWQITVGEPQILRILLTTLSFFSKAKLLASSGNVIYRSKYTLITRPIKYAFANFVLKRAKAILVDGVDIKTECIEHGIEADKIKVFYAGVNTELFKPSDTLSVFKEFALKNNKPYHPGKKIVLFSGRFSWENSPDLFLDILKDISDIQLIMVGNGPMMSMLQKKAIQSSSPVHFWEALPYSDLPVIYGAADVCFYPLSKYIGGISQVIPLSMSCGAVVVTRAIGDNIALVKNSMNGFILDEPDIDGIREIIRSILNSEIDITSIRKNARNTIISQWSIGHRNLEYAQFLRLLQ
jgi:glycosyltransferase involved in cell wall biosynthesis